MYAHTHVYVYIMHIHMSMYILCVDVGREGGREGGRKAGRQGELERQRLYTHTLMHTYVERDRAERVYIEYE